MNKNNLVYVGIAIIILIGLFFILRPKGNTTSQPTTQTRPNTSTQATSSAKASNVKIFDLVVKNKKLISGLETLMVREGDQVTINITADEDEELHLHGYDKSVDLTANTEAKLEFSANLTGRFPYELEKSKTEIGALEVQPK